jgi:Rieske Fe-S protein
VASPQPQLGTRVCCLGRTVGEVAHVIVDPLSLKISHIVVRINGTERQVPVSAIAVVKDDAVDLHCDPGQLADFPQFAREDFLTSGEVEIPHLEREIHAEPGEVLVPFPELEKSIPRRKFFAGFINVLAGLIALPLVWPVLRFIMKPMYAPFDNRWWPIGNVNQIKTEDVGVQFKFNKLIKDSVLQVNVDTNAWVIKASPTTLSKIYARGDITFYDEQGNALWINKATVPYVAYSGKCPHLGCGYKWRTHRTLGQVFLCPCHLSVYDVSGQVLDGPAPRPLDVLPIKVSSAGDVEVIDIQYKAGKKEEIRVA